MPPRRKRKATDDAVDESGPSKVAKKPKTAPKKMDKRVMPAPIPNGEILDDFNKKQWKIGGSVGKGGFGEIYLATPSGSKATSQTAQYAVKVEPHDNGPLFSELSFYRRVAKAEFIDSWIKSHNLSYLPVPKYIGSGAHERGKVKYRFMVMERFGEDVEKLFCAAGRKFQMKTVCYLALRIIEALEYLHDHEYVHADIKGSNILIGHSAATKHKVYLVDYGLAYRYIVDGKHCEYKPNPKKSHDGTIEFTSIDAHDGANPTRRGDMEILGYCLLQWAGGTLPWMGDLNNKPKVAAGKRKYKSNVSGLMKACFQGEKVPLCLSKYMELVYEYEYDETPDYVASKALFAKELKSNGWKDDKNSVEWLVPKPGSAKKGPSTPSKPSSAQNMGSPGIRKSPRISGMSPQKRWLENSNEDQPKRKRNRDRSVSPVAPDTKVASPVKTRGKTARVQKGKQAETKLKNSRVKSPKKRVQPAPSTSGSSDSKASSNELIPKVSYPTSLGYGEKAKDKAETFGSLAKKKQKRS